MYILPPHSLTTIYSTKTTLHTGFLYFIKTNYTGTPPTKSYIQQKHYAKTGVGV